MPLCTRCSYRYQQKRIKLTHIVVAVPRVNVVQATKNPFNFSRSFCLLWLSTWNCSEQKFDSQTSKDTRHFASMAAYQQQHMITVGSAGANAMPLPASVAVAVGAQAWEREVVWETEHVGAAAEAGNSYFVSPCIHVTTYAMGGNGMKPSFTSTVIFFSPALRNKIRDTTPDNSYLTLESTGALCLRVVVICYCSHCIIQLKAATLVPLFLQRTSLFELPHLVCL
jgi:hypothetical protein